MSKHEIEVQIAVAASPHYYLLQEDGGGYLRLPTKVLGDEQSPEVAAALFQEMTGEPLMAWIDLQQAGFHEVDGRKIVLYTTYLREQIALTQGKWVAIPEITEKATDSTLALLLYACNYIGASSNVVV